MLKHNKSLQKGFTIIETVLVLAIAGLIFLMVFIALPALQRAQKNQQYKNNVSLMVGAVQNYKSNNGGRLPDWEYMKGNRELWATVGSSKDIPLLSYAEAAGIPEGTHFKIFINYLAGHRLGESSKYPKPGRILIMIDSKCNGSDNVVGYKVPYKKGQAAIITLLEGNDLVYCENA